MYEFLIHAVAYGSMTAMAGRAAFLSMQELRSPRAMALKVLIAHIREFPELWECDRGARNSDHTLRYADNRLFFDFSDYKLRWATVNGEKVPMYYARKLLAASQSNGAHYKKLVNSLRPIGGQLTCN